METFSSLLFLFPQNENESVPVEILIKIFVLLKKSEIRQCLAVNKSWNIAARFLLGEDILVRWDDKEKKMASEFWHFPVCAAKVTEITLVSSNASYFITGLEKCPNLRILNLEHRHPWFLLHRLNKSLLVLPRIQEINVLPRYYKHEKSRELWSCLLRHKRTLRKLIIYRKSPVSSLLAKELIQCVSSFSNLKDLKLSGFLNVDLVELFRCSKNLQTLQLNHVSVSCTNERNSDDIKWPHLKKIIIHQSYIHYYTVIFLIKTCNNIENLELLKITLHACDQQQNIDLHNVNWSFSH